MYWIFLILLIILINISFKTGAVDKFRPTSFNFKELMKKPVKYMKYKNTDGEFYLRTYVEHYVEKNKISTIHKYGDYGDRSELHRIFMYYGQPNINEIYTEIENRDDEYLIKKYMYPNKFLKKKDICKTLFYYVNRQFTISEIQCYGVDLSKYLNLYGWKTGSKNALIFSDGTLSDSEYKKIFDKTNKCKHLIIIDKQYKNVMDVMLDEVERVLQNKPKSVNYRDPSWYDANTKKKWLQTYYFSRFTTSFVKKYIMTSYDYSIHVYG
jgi:hypothetical protein